MFFNINKKEENKSYMFKTLYKNFKHYNSLIVYSNLKMGENCFWNQTFDKGRLKNFVLWFLKNHGEHKTIKLVEELKSKNYCQLGSEYGVSDNTIRKWIYYYEKEVKKQEVKN